MKVKMEDVLPACGTIALDQREPFWVQPSFQTFGNSSCASCGRCEMILAGIEDVDPMKTRHDERVTSGGRGDV